MGTTNLEWFCFCLTEILIFHVHKDNMFIYINEMQGEGFV